MPTRTAGLLLLLAAIAAGMQFSVYQKTEQYKCGAFLRESRRDNVLGTFYQIVDQFCEWISLPFPHQELLSKKALSGDLAEIQESLDAKFWKWVDWQRGWLIFAFGIVAFTIVYVCFYVLYRICACCCATSSKKQATDARYDGCKRATFNLLAAILIFFTAMVVTMMVISSMYAHHGLDQLPNRMNQCIDDLNLYKRETDTQIRKLLIDDYQTLNQTISEQLGVAGRNVVDRVKRLTGAHVIDIFLNVSRDAQDMRETLRLVNLQIKDLNEEGLRFESEFTRLRNTANEELVKCVENELEPMRGICVRAERLLESLAITKFKLSAEIFTPETEQALLQIVDANITRLLGDSNRQFESLQNSIQLEINKKTYSAHNMLKQIGDDLFVVAETISTQLRQINFDPLYSGVSRVAELKKTTPFNYLKYSWIGSVVVASIIILLTLCFLIGILCGVCGRRPTFYKDDCCVRSTGSKFYSCAIWLSIASLVTIGILAAVLAIVVGNSSNLVCQPLRNPLSRPDIMSLTERYVEIWRENHRPGNDIQEILDQRSPADIIRACQRNETLYQIFDFDKKYHLNQLKDFEQESYVQLERFLKQSLDELPDIQPLDVMISKADMQDLEKLSKVNITKIGQHALESIKQATTELDLVAKLREFEEEIKESFGTPKAVSSVLEQIQEVETQFARPLRLRLESLRSNISHLDAKLSDLQVPVSSLLVKLQHAQALLSENMKQHFTRAAKEELEFLVGHIDHYIEHVRQQMQHEVSSCQPLAEIARHSTDALCTHTIDTFNGTWMCLVIFLLCLAPIVALTTSLIDLYNKMHVFPKYRRTRRDRIRDICGTMELETVLPMPLSAFGETGPDYASIDEASFDSDYDVADAYVDHCEDGQHDFFNNIIEPPSEPHHLSSFITDTYDTRPKPGYANYTYTDDYHRTYR